MNVYWVDGFPFPIIGTLDVSKVCATDAVSAKYQARSINSKNGIIIETNLTVNVKTIKMI